jgi:hypothetical protein
MSTLLDLREISVADSSSCVAFERAGSAMNPGFDRYLLLKGVQAYHLGNVCDTCEFLFQRLSGADKKVSPVEVGERLRHAVDGLEDGIIDSIERALPAGRYEAMVLELTPTLVQPGSSGDYFTHEQVELWGVDPFWNLPHDPRTEYYRGDPLSLGEGRELFEFAVPMMPSNWLEAETIDRYARRLATGERATALAISILDVKQPAIWEGDPAVREHWCLTHYLLDGHHKTLAAARTQRPLQLLSFLSADESLASQEQMGFALTALAA